MTLSCSRYHGVAGERALQLEDFVEAGSLRLPQLLLRHLDDEADRGVGVIVLVVGDQRRNLLCSVQHRLQNVLFEGLTHDAQSSVKQTRRSEERTLPLSWSLTHPGLKRLTWVQVLTGNSEISMVVESMTATSPLFMY